MTGFLNVLLYEVGWFACVLGAAYGRPWLGISIALLLVGVHLLLTTDRPNQVRLLLVALCVGIVVDSSLLALGVYRFPSGSIVDWLPPVWMSVLWLQFATTFRYCLKWLSGRYVLSAWLAFLGAPLAFLGGERLGAISFAEPRIQNLLILAIFWGVAMPLLIYASDRIHARATVAAGYRGIKTARLD